MSLSISQAIRSSNHIAYVTGLTGDEFYTDGGMRLRRIEELIQTELKQNGFQRIVFYSHVSKLHCYDDDSYALYTGSTPQQQQVSTIRPKHGLGMGKHVTGGPPVKAEKAGTGEAAPADSVWIPGKSSGVNVRNYGKTRLHGGEKNAAIILEEIREMMADVKTRTAIVINNMPVFIKDLQLGKIENAGTDLLTAESERLSADNKNLMLCIFPDNYMPDEEGGEISRICVCAPNAAELRNLLLYFRVNKGLRFRLSRLDALGLALRQAMAAANCAGTGQMLRIGDLYRSLESFGTEKEFTEDDCYAICGVSKPSCAREQLEQLIGMQSVKDIIASYGEKDKPQESVYPYLTSSRIREDRERKQRNQLIHFALTGNPGTGKTTVANLIGQVFFEMGILSHGKTKKVTRTDLVGEYIGQTAVKTQKAIDEAVGGVLFIDEAYTLKREKDSGRDFGQEAIDVIMEQMSSRTDLVVIAAGYPDKMQLFLDSNPGLRSRFTLLHIDDYTPAEMEKIVAFHARKNGAVLSEEMTAALPDFCENWVNLAGKDWGNAREAEKLIAAMLRSREKDPNRKTNENGQPVLGTAYLPEELSDYLRPVSERRNEVLRQLNAMTGLGEVKATVEKLRRRMVMGDITEPGHYIFTGNPGTGKTTVAGYMGKILRNMKLLSRGHLVYYTATEIMKKVGLSGSFEDAAAEAFDGVLFIDEAYQLVEDNRGIGSRIIASMLSFMEKPENRKRLSIIVAGYEDEMDDFIKTNPGLKSRFSETVHFENYSAEELHEILLRRLDQEGIVPDEDYKSKMLNALTKHVELHGKERNFGNARFIRENVFQGSLDARNRRLIAEFGDNVPADRKNLLTGADIPDFLSRFAKVPVKKKETAAEKTAMEEIERLIGFDEIKAKLKAMIALKKAAEEYDKPELLENLNLHWVLRGNPGTGKTMVAKLIGKVYKELGLLPNGKTVKVTRKDLVAEHVGGTAPLTQKAIDRAMGGILFIDEAYTLSRQNRSGTDFGQESIDALLEQMTDKNGEFAVIAAGYPKEMQTFLDANPGFASRFEQDFVLRDYTADELLQIFESKCNKKKFLLDDSMKETVRTVFANMIAAKIRNWANGREAENLERKMEEKWTLAPVLREDAETGAKVSCFTADHIPEAYRIYLTDPEQLLREQEEKRKEARKNGLRIPRGLLARPIAEYSFDKHFPEQEKSIVFIKVEGPEGSGSGSGSIITSEGHILTCNHVISGSTDIQVRLSPEIDGEKPAVWEKAVTLWADPDLDMAILKVPGSGYPALALRENDADTVKNELIYIDGYPFGAKISDNVNMLDASPFNGHVSSRQIYGGIRRIMCNIEAKRGDSGAPAFSKKDGTIIGILCGSHTEGDEQLTEEMQFLRPVQYVWDNVIGPEA